MKQIDVIKELAVCQGKKREADQEYVRLQKRINHARKHCAHQDQHGHSTKKDGTCTVCLTTV